MDDVEESAQDAGWAMPGERYRTMILRPRIDPLMMPVGTPEERRARHVVLVLDAFEYMVEHGGHGMSEGMLDDFMRRTQNALRGLAMAKAGGCIYSSCVCEPDHDEPTVKTFNGETRTRWPVEHACAEQSERCVETSGGALHYVGNTTTIPGATVWCIAPVPR